MKNIILNIKLKLIELLINSIWKYNNKMCKEKFIESTLDDLYTLINMILGFNNHKYTKLELYTLTCVELTQLKEELMMSDKVTI